MAIRRYHEMILVADEVGTDETTGKPVAFTVWVFDSPAGKGETKERVDLPDDLFQQVRFLEGRDLDGLIGDLMDLGEALPGRLPPPSAREKLGGSRRGLRDGEGLRLRLRLADELADIPWEYALVRGTHGERTPNDFLALDPRV